MYIYIYIYIYVQPEKLVLMYQKCLYDHEAQVIASDCSGRIRITLAANFLYFLYFHPRSELIS